MTARPGPSVWPGTNLPIRGLILLLLVGLAWGLNWPIMKVGMSAIPVFTFRALIFAIGGPILLVLCLSLGYSLKVPRAHWPALIVVSACFAGLQIFSGYGVLHTSTGRAAVMVYTMPVWAILLGALWLKDPLTWRKLASLALGMSGAILLLAADLGTLGGAPLGMIFMITTAVTWAIATVVQKKVLWTVPTVVLVTWQTVLGGIPIYAGAAFVDYGDISFPGLWPILALAYNIFVAFAFGFYAYLETVRLFPVAVTTIGVMIAPVVGVFSGALMLSEPLGALELGALALVLAAIGLPVLAHRRV